MNVEDRIMALLRRAEKAPLGSEEAERYLIEASALRLELAKGQHHDVKR